MVQPSSRREGFSAIPNVKWEDVGGLELLRREFDRYIVRRIKYPEVYEVNSCMCLILALNNFIFYAVIYLINRLAS